MKKLVAGSMMLLTAVFSAQSAEALTVSEYNSLNRDQQNRAMSAIVSGTYKGLVANGVSEEKLQCMRDFFSRQEVSINGNTVVSIPGIIAVYDQIDMANAENDLNVRIEDLVMGAINAQCESTDVADTEDAEPVTPPPAPNPAG